jgi:phenylacetate-CoA ligase
VAVGRRVHSFLLGHLAGLAYRAAGTWQRMQALQAVDHLDGEQREAWQMARLRVVLAHAFRSVPYYRQWARAAGARAEDFRCLADLQALPVVGRRDLQERLEELRAEQPRGGRPRLNHTGGSTGEPVSFYQDALYRAWANADKQRWYLQCGYCLGEPLAFLWGSDADAQAHKTWVSRWWDRWGRNLVWINTFALHEQDLPRVAQVLARQQPVLLVGYVRSLTMYARYLEASGAPRPRLRAVQASAEVLTPADRALLERVLQAPVFDRYGCREVGIIAHECAAHMGLHVSAGTNVVELLGPDGQPGRFGRVVVSNLYNLAMPLLRYDTGDVAEWAEGECGCGRRTARLARVWGRRSDLIVTPSGRLLHGEFFTHLFYGAPEVRQFQVVQESKERLVISLVPRPGADLTRLQKRLRHAIQEHGDPAFEVVFRIVERIPVSGAGKYRFTMSRVTEQW